MSAPMARSYSMMSASSVKLDFSRVTIRGRSSELSILMAAYDRCPTSNEGNVALVSGETPGCGKTMLVQAFLDRVKNGNPNALCSTAKFDHVHSSGNSAIPDALDEICSQILRNSLLLDLRAKLKDALGSEFHVLSQFVPSICKVLNCHHDATRVNDKFLDGRGDSDFVGLKHILKVCLHTSQPLTPLTQRRK